MQRRFHADPRIRAVESLLFERIPITKPVRGEAPTRLAVAHVTAGEEARDVTFSKETAVPKVHLYGNGRYALMVSNSGAGYSRWNQFDLTRWRSDPTLDEWGSYLYLRDVRTNTVWAATPQPLNGTLGKSSVTFSEDRADFHRTVLGIETVMSVTVSPGRRRGTAAADHRQSQRPVPSDGDHQLHGIGSGAERCRCRSPGLQQDVRRNHAGGGCSPGASPAALTG